jgi:hypothetical protein
LRRPRSARPGSLMSLDSLVTVSTVTSPEEMSLKTGAESSLRSE